MISWQRCTSERDQRAYRGDVATPLMIRRYGEATGDPRWDVLDVSGPQWLMLRTGLTEGAAKQYAAECLQRMGEL
jgi:hypothetical protein